MRGAVAVRVVFAAGGVALGLASAAWVQPAEWLTYLVFIGFAFAFSFVWLDSALPTSVAHMATANAFAYIAGPPVLACELAARTLAYPVLFTLARRGWLTLPRPLRPLVQKDAAAAQLAQLDLAAMLGLAAIGSATRMAVAHWAPAFGAKSLITAVVVGEPIAYGVMGLLSAALPLPTREYVVNLPHRLPAEDERVDVVFASGLIVPYLVLLIVYGWMESGLVGAAVWSLTSIPPHVLVGILIRRRHLLDEHREAIEQANALLAQKRAEIEDFAYTVAHDLKAPLNAIAMLADCTLEQDLPGTARDDVAHIMRLAIHTERMTVDLLAMVRIVSEPEPVGTVDLGAVTNEVLEMLRSYVTARGVEVRVAAPLPVIPGQAAKLRHVMANLVGNAVRFVPEGSGRVEIAARRDGSSVLLGVQDNGPGIPAGYQRAIFEMFKRVPGAGEAGGSGVGLALVKRIVEGHGGTVWVEPGDGVGSAFRVRLPG